MAVDPTSCPAPLPSLTRAIEGLEGVAAFARFLVDLTVTSTRAEKGSLLLPAPCGEELFILCSRGIAPEIAFQQRFRFGKGICGQIASSRRPVFVPEIDKDRRYRRRRRHAYASPSFMACPIVERGQLLGLLTLSGRQDGELFSSRDFQFGLQVAERAAEPLKELRARQTVERHLQEIGGAVPRGVEWRNRLHAIHGAIYFLRQGRNLSAEQREEFLELIASETGRLIAMADREGVGVSGNLTMEDRTNFTDPL